MTQTDVTTPVPPNDDNKSKWQRILDWLGTRRDRDNNKTRNTAMTDDTERLNNIWELFIRILARTLAVVVIILFTVCLIETIRIGSTTTSLQRMVTSLTQLRTTMLTAEAARREAETRAARFPDVPEAGADADDRFAAFEARLNHRRATDDFNDAAGRYYAAVCAAGIRLADMGLVSGRFMPDTGAMRKCARHVPKSVASPTAPLVAPPPTTQEPPPAAAPGQPTAQEPPPATAPGQPTAQTPPPAEEIPSPADRIEAVIVMIDQYTVLTSSYILPILFGMLGAMIFALRDMVQTPAHIETLPKTTGYILRIFLGAIFGLIIGYVNFGGAGTATVAASPLLLSLVAGFATDAVISLLDRIAATFGTRMDDPVAERTIVMEQTGSIGDKTTVTTTATFPSEEVSEVPDSAATSDSPQATPGTGPGPAEEPVAEKPSDQRPETPRKDPQTDDTQEADIGKSADDADSKKEPEPIADSSSVGAGIDGLKGNKGRAAPEQKNEGMHAKGEKHE